MCDVKTLKGQLILYNNDIIQQSYNHSMAKETYIPSTCIIKIKNEKHLLSQYNRTIQPFNMSFEYRELFIC